MILYIFCFIHAPPDFVYVDRAQGASCCPVSFYSSSTLELHSEKLTANGGVIIVIILLFQLVYTVVVMENSPSSFFVLKVSASDPDVGANGQISYTLHGPNADKFHLDHRTGTRRCHPPKTNSSWV